MRYYPVFLDLAGQPCVVLGDGKFAAEKVAGLRAAGASVRVISNRDYRPGELSGARLVVDASEDAEINRQAWEEAERAGILINVVDRPAQCRFIAPAIVRRDPLLIAISTSGESPFLASAVRAWLERWLGPEWGPFTALVGRIRRKLRQKGVSIEEQTKAFRRLASSDVLDLLRAGRVEAAKMRAQDLARTDVDHAGRVALVGAGPGDPELITVKGRRMLAAADYVLHDALISKRTLALCGRDTTLEAVGKRGGKESARQDYITARMIDLARAGNFVVRLKGGDPFVFGRGGEELRDLVAAGIDVVVVPGVTSALAAATSIGVPVTMRGVASSVTITNAQSDRIGELARASDTLVVLMGRASLAKVAAEIDGSRPAALVSGATLSDQRSVTGAVADISRLADEAHIEAPATLIVGDVVTTR
ncbi:MAG TPA: uroporphyrinogen-III C-methyltransferase [Candidatus Dormibacteraeota bacterium]|nr:uroporphyrinogen-III C-methyltransferase [Candidatus Dormibacteraeota bacterium]